MTSLKTPHTSSIDEHWYHRLKPLLAGIGETFVTLEPPANELQHARHQFIRSGYQDNPRLFPVGSHITRLASYRNRLATLQNDIVKTEEIVEVRTLYTERIREVIANIDMIIAAARNDRKAFLQTNTFIYGQPDKKVFAASCAWIRQEVMTAHNRVDTRLLDKLLEIVPDVSGDSTLLQPRDEVFHAVQSAHFAPRGYIEQLFAHTNIPEQTIITPSIGDPITRQVIKNIGSDFALTDSPSGLWAVLQSKRQVIRPKDLSLTPQAFMGIVCHEIGSHLLESTNGAAGKLKLLELGLDRYECGNEGRAFLREQIMYEHFTDYINQPTWSPTKASWEYRVAIHLIISLASGLYKRNYHFSDLYHLLTLLFEFWTAKRNLPIDKTVIHDGVWSMAVRALKGTDGTSGAYLKDIVYLEGNIRCWQAAGKNPDIILYGDIGKFDIANTMHVQQLSRLGIIEI